MRTSTATVLFVLYAGMVAFVSLRPIEAPGVGEWDKLYHLIVYLVFALLGYRVASSDRGYDALCVGIFCYGCLMEIAQSFIPARVMSGFDVMANGAGVLVGWQLANRLGRSGFWN